VKTKIKIHEEYTVQETPSKEVLEVIKKQDEIWRKTDWATASSESFTQEETENLESWRKIMHEPKFRFMEYNQNVSKLGRPTVIGFISVGSVYRQRQRDPRTWKPIGPSFEVDSTPYNFCLMSNNEVWVYFGSQKRESMKRKPNWFQDAIALIPR